MEAAYFDYVSNNNTCTHAYTKIQSIGLDTEMIEENHFSFSTIFQHFSFAKDVHFHSTRIYAQSIPNQELILIL